MAGVVRLPNWPSSISRYSATRVVLGSFNQLCHFIVTGIVYW
jgi:hypothetical protein